MTNSKQEKKIMIAFFSLTTPKKERESINQTPQHALNSQRRQRLIKEQTNKAKGRDKRRLTTLVVDANTKKRKETNDQNE